MGDTTGSLDHDRSPVGDTFAVTLDPFLALGGLFAGSVVGMTGLGGVAIVTPMLLLLFNIPPAVAVSTDVVSAAVMKPVGASVHIRRRTPYYPVVLWLSLGSVPGVLIGTWSGPVLTMLSAGMAWTSRVWTVTRCPTTLRAVTVTT